MIASAVAIAAVVIAALSFFASQREVRRRAKVDYVSQLEGRIEDCEKARVEMRRKISGLEQENIELMRRVVGLEKRA